MKRCSKCGEFLELAEFNKDARSRDGYTSNCRACRAAYNSAYYSENRETVLAKDAEYYQSHRDKVRTRTAAYNQENKEVVSARKAIYRQEHREEIAAYNAAYSRANPDRMAAKVSTRRALRAGSGGSHTDEEWLDLCADYGHRCLCCGRSGVKLTRDHVLPLALGGSDNIDNLQPLCLSCNSSKQDKYIDYR